MPYVRTDGFWLNTCGHVIPALPEFFDRHWEGYEHQSCSICGKQFALWEEVCKCFTDAGRTFSVLAPLGGQRIFGDFELLRGETFTLDLNRLDVPPNAVVRAVYLTCIDRDSPPEGPDGGLQPTLLVGNKLQIQNLPHLLTFYPMPFGKPPEKQAVTIHVEFLDVQASATRTQLADALVAHGDGDHRKAVIEAHTAADLALEQACARVLDDLSGQEVGNMSLMAKVGVLTALLRAQGHRPPEALVSSIRLLNSRRNSVAHPRRRKQPLDENVAATCLAAALFALTLAERFEKLYPSPS